MCHTPTPTVRDLTWDLKDNVGTDKNILDGEGKQQPIPPRFPQKIWSPLLKQFSSFFLMEDLI